MDIQHDDHPVNLFCSYAHEDEMLRNELEKHLSLLQRQGIITTWHDRQIVPGTDWAHDIDNHLNEATIILLLISPDFLASDYCYNMEMQRALERDKKGKARVIPIILRPVDWHGAPFAHLQALPRDSKPVTEWKSQDAALREIAQGIRTAIEHLRRRSSRNYAHLSSTKSRRSRGRLLKSVREFWVKGVLEQSLRKATFIEPGLQEQPNAIANPWRLVMQETDQPAHTLPPGTRITQVYDEADGELLILGEPGAGKTTLLLELARDLLDRAEQNEQHPIPVVFHLASWSKELSLAQWLAFELQKKYQIPSKMGQLWIEGDQVLPLLDGLDEMDATYQEKCIRAINIYRQEHSFLPLVVCSRSIEYLAQKKHLLLQKAVVIQPLTAQQVEAYLISAGEQLDALRFILRDDPDLRELTTIPLMLSVMILAYQGRSVEDLLKEMKDASEAQQQDPLKFMAEISRSKTPIAPQRRWVFATYVHQMLHRRGENKHYSSQETTYWLTWIAQQRYEEIDKTVFLYPPRRFLQGWQYWFCKGTEFTSWFILLVALLGFGVLVFQYLSIVSIILLVLELAIFGGLILFGIKYETSYGNPEVLRSARNGIIRTLYCIIFLTILVLLFPQRWLILLLSVVAISGGFFLLFLLTELQWKLIRMLLRLAGHMPWNYKDFLDYAVERILLRKVGNNYIFIHRLLRDYFASLDATVPKRAQKHRHLA